MNGAFYPVAALGKKERVVTAVLIVLLAAAGMVVWIQPGTTPFFKGFIVVVLLLALPLCWLYRPQGFLIYPDRLEIKRPLFSISIPLQTIDDAWYQPGAMKGAFRVCGAAAGFVLTGWFYSKKMGFFRAYVTNLSQTVIIETTRRTLVISPADAEEFTEALVKMIETK